MFSDAPLLLDVTGKLALGQPLGKYGSNFGLWKENEAFDVGGIKLAPVLPLPYLSLQRICKLEADLGLLVVLENIASSPSFRKNSTDIQNSASNLAIASFLDSRCSEKAAHFSE
jgi:hypothetical protein